MRLFIYATAFAVTLLSAGAANCATVTYLIEFEAHNFVPGITSNPAPFASVSGSVTITLDPAVMVVDQTSGIVLNSLTFPLSSPISYTYGGYALFIGGLDVGAGALLRGPGFTDILLIIESFETSPSLLNFVYTHLSDTSGAWGSGSGSVTVKEVAQTPLPSALPLFAAGLAGLGLVARRRKRVVAAITN